jgi:hypothetical protein
VIAHGRDANPALVCVGDAADRGAGRHQQGVVELENRGREVADVGGPGVKRQKQKVARASLETLDGLGRSRVLQENDLNPDACGKRSSDLCPHTPQLPGCRILDVLWQEQPDPDLAGLHEVGDSRIGRLLSGGISWGSHLERGCAVAIDNFLHQAGDFGLLDKFGHIGEPSGVALWNDHPVEICPVVFRQHLRTGRFLEILSRSWRVDANASTSGTQ